jgi:hypothetical protein
MRGPPLRYPVTSPDELAVVGIVAVVLQMPFLEPVTLGRRLSLRFPATSAGDFVRVVAHAGRYTTSSAASIALFSAITCLTTASTGFGVQSWWNNPIDAWIGSLAG